MPSVTVESRPEELVAPSQRRESPQDFMFTIENFAGALGMETEDLFQQINTGNLLFAFDVDGCLINSEAPLFSETERITTLGGLHDSSWLKAIQWGIEIRNQMEDAPEVQISAEQIVYMTAGSAEPKAIDIMMEKMALDLPEGQSLPFSRFDFMNVRYHYLWEMLEKAEDLVLPGVRELISFCQDYDIPMVVNSSSSRSTLTALFYHAFFDSNRRDSFSYDTFEKTVSATDFEKEGNFKPDTRTWLVAADHDARELDQERITIILDNGFANIEHAFREISSSSIALFLEPEERRRYKRGEQLLQISKEEEKSNPDFTKHRALVISDWTELVSALERLVEPNEEPSCM